MGFMNSPTQMHQGGADTNYQQKPVSGHAVPNHVGPSPIRPPMGFDMGNSDGHFERDDPHSYGRFDGTKALQQQPKLAPLPTSQNLTVIIFGTVMLNLSEAKSSPLYCLNLCPTMTVISYKLSCTL